MFAYIVRYTYRTIDFVILHDLRDLSKATSRNLSMPLIDGLEEDQPK